MKPLIVLTFAALLGLAQPALAQSMKVPNPYLVRPEQFSDTDQTPEQEKAEHEESKKAQKARLREEEARKKAARKMLVIDKGRTNGR